jgi:formylglycine-generating enzyme required for sulfatase activity
MDLPTLTFRSYRGVEFVHVPAGAFCMGLSADEEAEARRICLDPPIWWESLRPIRDVSVQSFWISSAPITHQQLRENFPEMAAAAARTPTTLETHVARLAREKAEQCTHLFGGRLATEIEWEYACRAGTKGLFTFGQLPEEDGLLEPWMSWDGEAGARNAFGLRTLFTGEWCSDTWRLSYYDPETEEPGVSVVRGGAAYFWPWQDEEWTWCMSAVRAPSTELPEPECAFRIVMDREPS